MGTENASTAAVWGAEILRQALPDCQPQEGSPANTFTDAEKEKLQPFIPNMQVHHGNKKAESSSDAMTLKKKQQIDILEPWTALDQPEKSLFESDCAPECSEFPCASSSPQEAPQQRALVSSPPLLDWHGAPRFATPTIDLTRQFRQAVRQGRFTGPTNGVCPGFLQCNLVILPQGKHAFDFLLFCQRNPKACPLIEVCEAGSPVPVGVAPDADLRTDCPKYVWIRSARHGARQTHI